MEKQYRHLSKNVVKYNKYEGEDKVAIYRENKY